MSETKKASVSSETVLAAVINAKGEKTAEQIANALGMNLNTFTQAVQKLRTTLKEAGRSTSALKMQRKQTVRSTKDLLGKFDELVNALSGHDEQTEATE